MMMTAPKVVACAIALVASLHFIAATAQASVGPAEAPMLPQLKQDADGGVTLIIQNESPGQVDRASAAAVEMRYSGSRTYWKQP